MEISPDTLIARSPSVVTSESDGGLLMMRVDGTTYQRLDAVASDIWSRLDSEPTFSDLVDQLAADYDATTATITAQLRVLLEEMCARDLIALRDAAVP